MNLEKMKKQLVFRRSKLSNNYLILKIQNMLKFLSEITIIDACVDLVTINGRPFSMLNDLGFRRILDPILNGFQKKLKINSDSIR